MSATEVWSNKPLDLIGTIAQSRRVIRTLGVGACRTMKGGTICGGACQRYPSSQSGGVTGVGHRRHGFCICTEEQPGYKRSEPGLWAHIESKIAFTPETEAVGTDKFDPDNSNHRNMVIGRIIDLAVDVYGGGGPSLDSHR